MTDSRQRTIQKIVKRKNGTRRVQFVIEDESITDQEMARELSMASLKAKLEKNIPITNITGNSFHSLEPLKYTNLQDALDFHQSVIQQFESLPSGLRKEMGNDIRNFEIFFSDPKNHESLQKYGLVKPRDASNTDIVNELKAVKESLPKPPSKNTSDQSSDTHPNKQK